MRIHAALSLVAVAAAAAACGGYDFSSRFATSYDYAGTSHYATAAAAADDLDAALERATIEDAAIREFACSAVALARPYGRAYVAIGCGHRAVYVAARTLSDQLEAVPGRDGGRYVIHVVAANVTAQTPLEPRVAPGTTAARDVFGWRQLVATAAADLACPPDQITPDIVPQSRAPFVPTADGCGRRATYLRDGDQLRLVGLFAMPATAVATGIATGSPSPSP